MDLRNPLLCWRTYSTPLRRMTTHSLRDSFRLTGQVGLCYQRSGFGGAWAFRFFNSFYLPYILRATFRPTFQNVLV